MGAQWGPSWAGDPKLINVKSRKGQSDNLYVRSHGLKEVSMARNSALAGNQIGGLLTSGCELLSRIACFCIFLQI